ncbi:hypothetical protein H2201_006651 [Coniosporium apollinis]|uniref:PRISE-like Rossmann-fold domain-containing protein n=1 Tax=Coniosporium apollinis TaxID=61459 RepID=A0ABQ9NM15_9PEZI|nr:hypothetical protein H2201_006651 [Coniosporium apollinis]
MAHALVFGASRPKLNLVSNLNLAEGTVEEFTALLKGKVEDIADVTHAFYFAYRPEQDAEVEVAVNRGMLERAIGALNHLSPKLRFVVFPSGTKAYGIHIPGGVFTAPFRESMGRLPDPAGSTVFYYEFQDILKEQSKGSNWTWCDVRPDAVIGFVPNGSAFNLTAHWANYLSTYALVEGKGAKVPFPGTQSAYSALYNEASADIIARFSIWAALHPDKAGCGRIFNIADQARPSRMSERWPALAKYFGLEGIGPVDDPNVLKPGEFVKKHQCVLEEHGMKSNQVFKADFLDTYGYYLTSDRQLSLDKARAAGFSEEIDPASSWFKAFDRCKMAGMIPE